MTSTLRAKSGGAWVGPVGDGNLRVKVNGVWVSPTSCYVKSGGAWRNTGYVGPPSQPSAVWVQAWDYTQTLTGFSGPSGGPAIDYYHIEKLNAAGTPVEGYYDTSGSRWWSTPQDTRWQFRVRSHGSNGLWSDWSGPYLKVGIGHPETYNYGYVQRTRGWSAGGDIGGAGTVNNLAGFGVPGNVICSSIHWYLWMSDGSSTISIYPPAYVENGDRYIEIILNESYVYDRPNWPSPLDGWDYPQFWGNGGRTGFVAREGGEAGWLWKQVYGYIWLGGTEYYDNYEIVSTNPAQGNYYW